MIEPAFQGPRLGVDFGGTSIKAGLVRGARVETERAIETRAGSPPGDILDAIARLARSLQPSPERLGLAIPGELDADGRCWRLPNVPGFEGVAIARELEERLGCPVRADNDATVAALGEARFGHGLRYRSFLLVTLGTGIGGGLVLDGVLRRGSHGFAGEVGHVFIDRAPDAWRCAAGSQGSIEAYAGTQGLLRSYAERGGTAREISELARAAARGEAAAREVFAQMGAALGLGLCSIQHVLDLDAIVFSGGVSRAFDLFEPTLRRVLRERCYAPPLGEVPLLLSVLGEQAGLVGAAHLPYEAPPPKS